MFVKNPINYTCLHWNYINLANCGQFFFPCKHFYLICNNHFNCNDKNIYFWHCLPSVGVVDQQSSPPHEMLTWFMVPNWYVIYYNRVGRCEYHRKVVCNGLNVNVRSMDDESHRYVQMWKECQNFKLSSKKGFFLHPYNANVHVCFMCILDDSLLSNWVMGGHPWKRLWRVVSFLVFT